MISHRSHLRVHTAWIAFMDIGCLLAGLIVAVSVVIGAQEFAGYVREHLDGWLAFFGSILLANYFVGSYGIQTTYSRFNLIVSWMFSVGFALLVLSIMSYAGLRVPLGRGVLFFAVMTYSAASLFLKLLIYRSLFRSSVFLCRVVVLGVSEHARQLRSMVESTYVLPAHKVLAYIRMHAEEDEMRPSEVGIMDGVAVIDASGETIEDVVASLGVELIIISHDEQHDAVLFYRQLRRLRFSGVEVLEQRHAAEIYNSKIPLEMINETTMMEISQASALPLVGRFKRLFDIVVSVLTGLVCLPLIVLIYVLIKAGAIQSPVFYTQQRVGRFGDLFRMYKFRTMNVGAEDETGAIWAVEDDDRVTYLGRLLRRCRMDEIPQLFNILRGDMSFVGPRPERPEFIEELEKRIPYYNERANVLPGLTGWAQVRYSYGNTHDDAARKLEYDLYYIKYLSIGLDVQIILRTIRIVLFGKDGLG